MTYYTVYKVTNKINGKFYIGTHKTKNLNDGYMGSGKYLTHSINKHGIENFEKEILFVYDNPDAMYAKEAEIVDEDFLAEENTYNLRIGGMGGFDYINNTGKNGGKLCRAINLSSEDRIRGGKNLSKRFRTDPIFQKEYSEKRRSIAHGIEGFVGYFTGRKHTEDTKKKISIQAKRRLKDPTKNSQYGTRWIYSESLQKSKKILKTEPLPEGWREGRKIKF